MCVSSAQEETARGMPPRSGRNVAGSRLVGGPGGPDAAVDGAAAAGGAAGAAPRPPRRSVWHKVQRWVLSNRAALSVVAAAALLVAVSYLLSAPVRPAGWRTTDPKDEIRNKQLKNNRDTRASWDSYASHRSNVTSRVLTQLSYASAHTVSAHGFGAPRVLVLGAGNCNDVDLRVLLAHPTRPRLHLVDVDLDALNAGVARQMDGEVSSDVAGFVPGVPANADTRARVTTQRVDLTAVHELVADWPIQPPAPSRGGRPRPVWYERKAQSGSPATNAQVAEVVDALELSPPVLISTNASLPADADPHQPLTPDQQFDIVVSTCVLSQLIASLYDGLTLGVTPQELSARLVMAVRAHHVSVVNAHLVAGGLGLIITDMVSSLTFHKLPRLRHDELPGALAGLIKDENFFHGTNPHRLMRDVQVTHGARVMRDSVQVLNPWLWHFHDAHPPRTYLVYAVGWRTLVPGADATDSELAAQQETAQRELAELEGASSAAASDAAPAAPSDGNQ